jgi:hypothetical protein
MERLLTVGLDLSAESVGGWVQVEEGEREAFYGYVELMAVLERARTGADERPALGFGDAA